MASASGIRAGRAHIELLLKDNTSPGLKDVQYQLRKVSAAAAGLGKTFIAMGAAIAAPLALSVRTFGAFSDEMLKVKAVTGAAAKEFDDLSNKAKELGRTTSFTASQVAGAMTELGRAGFNPKEIDAAIGSVLSLARATDTELPRAAEIAAAALRGFNLEAKDTPRVADILTQTVNASAQTMDDLGEAMKFVAPIAFSAGESIEETAAAIGILANNGIKGSAAGTQIARAFKELSKSGPRETIEALGVEVVDAQDNMRSLAEILTEVGQATQGLGSATKLAIFEEVFGRGSAAAQILSRGSAQFDDLLSKIQSAEGVADKTAKTMDSGLGGSLRRLMSAVEGVGISIGTSLSGPIQAIAGILEKVAGVITALNNRFPILTKVVAALGVAFVALGAVLLGIAAIAKIAAFAIGAVGIATKALGITLAILLNPLTILAAAIAGVVAVFTLLLTKTKTGQKIIRGIIALFKAMAAPIIAIAKAITDILVKSFEILSAVFVGVLTFLFNQIKNSIFGKVFVALVDGAVKSAIRAFSAVKDFVLGIFDKIKSAFNAVVDFVKRQLNKLIDIANKIPKVNIERAELSTDGDEDLKPGKRLVRYGEQIYQEKNKREKDIDALANAEKELNSIKEDGDEESLKRRQDLERKIRDLRIRGIAQDLQREREAINAKYDDEVAVAGEAADEIALINQARAIELQQLKKKHQNELARREADLTDRIHDLRISHIDDELLRSLEQIKTRYAREIAEAQGNAKLITLIEKARQLEIDRLFDENDNEINQAAAERALSQADALIDQLDDIEKLRIQVELDGLEERLALLNLERRKALADAKESGVDPSLVKEEFELKADLLRQRVDQSKQQSPSATTVGTFDTRFLRALTPKDDIQKKQLEEQKKTRKELQDQRRGAIRTIEI